MTDKCTDCITPPGTRCESAPGNCPYRIKYEVGLATRLRDIADLMAVLADDMRFYGKTNEWSKYASEMQNASAMMRQWSDSIMVDP